MSARRGRAIVTGMIASYPLGGVAWDYGQYLLGLEQLGFEVFYLEDTGWEAFDPDRGDYGSDYSYGLAFLQTALARLCPGLEDRWCVRKMDGELVGPAAARLDEIIASADLFLNVSGSAILRPTYVACRNKVLIDTDPGLNHFLNYPKQDAYDALQRGDLDAARVHLAGTGIAKVADDFAAWAEASKAWEGSHSFRAHDRFFTYAERLGAPDCSLPTLGLDWRPTRPPVVGDCWRPALGGPVWTTVMSWKTVGGDVAHEGVRYGGKEMEFGRVEDLPARTGAKLEVAVSGHKAPVERWRSLGWAVRDAPSVSATLDDYRNYLAGSRGEFSVAKNTYVATGSGWFSCRSACYLAAGLPVVVQDTGFSKVLPVGAGVLAFTTAEEAAAALDAVEADYDRHSRAAREIADSHFEARGVLTDLLGQAGLG